MVKRCVICNNQIKENCNKLNGTILKVNNEKKRNQFIYVCFECQKKQDWIEKAKIKGV